MARTASNHASVKTEQPATMLPGLADVRLVTMETTVNFLVQRIPTAWDALENVLV